MGYLKLARFIGVAMAGAAFLAVLWLAYDRFHQKDRADAAGRCEVAAISPSGKLDDCGPNVQARVSADRRSVICESALLPQLRPETRFTASQSCGSGIQHLIAQSDAQAARITGLEAQAAKVRSDTADAVARAEARGRSEQTRKTNAQQLIQAAPRSADGRIACDAVCLRKLAE